jgi:hypothetical protein
VAYFAFWQGKGHASDGACYKLYSELWDELGCSRHYLWKVLKSPLANGVIKVTRRDRGKLYFLGGS